MKSSSIPWILVACLLSILCACGDCGDGASLAPAPAPLKMSVDRPDLPAATANVQYDQAVILTASGGTSPYVYSCAVSGGIGLSASISSTAPTVGAVSCAISGTPLATGTVTVTFSVMDGTGASASAASLSVNINTSPDPLANWHWRKPLSGETQNFVSVTYGDGTFVAVGDSLSGGAGMIRTSTDGGAWNITAAGTNVLNGVTYGNGTFVAVGDAGTILTSTDGITWIARISGTSEWIGSITYGNNFFLAVGGNGTILTSVDGITWTSTTAGYSFSHATYGNGAFVAAGPTSNGAGFLIFTSTDDGLTWATTFAEEACRGAIGCAAIAIRAITFGNGVFLAVPSWGSFLTSTDGRTWTVVHHSQASAGTDDLNAVAYGHGSFVGVGDSGKIVSADADDVTTWTARTSANTITLRGLTYGNGTFVAVGDNGAIIQSDPLE